MSTRISHAPREAVSDTAAPRGRIYDNVLQTVGGTPMVRLPRLAADEQLVADLVLKLEFFNPLGSVKDRIGLGMIDAAEKGRRKSPPAKPSWSSRRAAIPASPWLSWQQPAATA